MQQVVISTTATEILIQDIILYFNLEQVKTIKCWRASELFHGYHYKPIISGNEINNTLYILI